MYIRMYNRNIVYLSAASIEYPSKFINFMYSLQTCWLNSVLKENRKNNNYTSAQCNYGCLALIFSS